MRPSEDPAWQRHSGEATPDSFSAAWLASLLLVLLGALLYASLLPVVVARWRQVVRAQTARSSKSRRLVLWILVNVASNAVQEAFNVWTHTASAGASASRCHAAQKVSALLYGVATAAVYWVLVVRAEATLDRRSPRHMLVYRLCKLGVTAGVPGLMVLAAVYFEGRVLFGWACTQQLPDAVVVLFIALDLSLSVLLLLLFYIPVRQHLAALKSKPPAMQDERARIHRMALRALWLSLAQVLSTLAVQLVGLATQTALSDAEAPDLSFLRFARYCLYTIDLWLNTGCMLAMSNVWVPSGWTAVEQRFGLHRGSNDGEPRLRSRTKVTPVATAVITNARATSASRPRSNWPGASFTVGSVLGGSSVAQAASSVDAPQQRLT